MIFLQMAITNTFGKEFDFDWPLKTMTSLPDSTPTIIPLKTTVVFLTECCTQRSKDRNKCVHPLCDHEPEVLNLWV